MTNEELFNNLRKKYNQYVQFKLFSKNFDSEIRKDISQIYWLEIWRRITVGQITVDDVWEAYKMKTYLAGEIKDYIRHQNCVKRKAQNTAISLTSQISHSNESLLVDSIIDHNCLETDAMLLKKEKNGILIKALKILKKQERELIQKYYWEGQTLEQLGPQFCVTKQRIKQKIDEINKKLKNYLVDYDYFSLNS